MTRNWTQSIRLLPNKNNLEFNNWLQLKLVVSLSPVVVDAARQGAEEAVEAFPGGQTRLPAAAETVPALNLITSVSLL